MPGPPKYAVAQFTLLRLKFDNQPDLQTSEGFQVFMDALNKILVDIQKASLDNLNAVKKTLASDRTDDVTYFVAATSGGPTTTPLRFKYGVNVTIPFVPPVNAPPNNSATTPVTQPGAGHPTRPYP